MTLKEFIYNYHKYGKCLNQIKKPKNKLNKKQIKIQYNKYINKLSKIKEFTIDEKWVKVKEEVFKRDGYCQLFDKLNSTELALIKESLFNETKIIDPAHIFGKAAYPHLKYDSENVVCLMRLFHSRLDSYHNPITGGKINELEHEAWWKRIVGNDRYNKLKQKALKRGKDHE